MSSYTVKDTQSKSAAKKNKHAHSNAWTNTSTKYVLKAYGTCTRRRQLQRPLPASHFRVCLKTHIPSASKGGGNISRLSSACDNARYPKPKMSEMTPVTTAVSCPSFSPGVSSGPPGGGGVDGVGGGAARGCSGVSGSAATDTRRRLSTAGRRALARRARERDDTHKTRGRRAVWKGPTCGPRKRARWSVGDPLTSAAAQRAASCYCYARRLGVMAGRVVVLLPSNNSNDARSAPLLLNDI